MECVSVGGCPGSSIYLRLLETVRRCTKARSIFRSGRRKIFGSVRLRFANTRAKCSRFLEHEALSFLMPRATLRRGCLASEEFQEMAFTQYIGILVILVAGQAWADFEVSTQDLKVHVGDQKSFELRLTEPLSENVFVQITVQYNSLVSTHPQNITINESTSSNWLIYVKGLNAGHSIVSINVTPSNVTNFSQAFVRVTVEKSDALYHVSSVVGWMYFLAWSVSFYPQIYSNYKRKSVVGLNFDYLSLNLVGFIMYALFNCGLYWIPEVELQYFSRYPKGLNPVQVNDIFFALHATFATVITIVQCFVYENGAQRVSTTARIIHGIFATFISICLVLAIINTIEWLQFLYYCSYVKLSITLIKYVPQAFYNYKRKSTVGWSIGNIFLDFTGGTLSMLQMILNAYNYDDWESIFGDPTKFGLGFFSVAFDIFFIIQHYVLYRLDNENARSNEALHRPEKSYDPDLEAPLKLSGCCGLLTYT